MFTDGFKIICPVPRRAMKSLSGSKINGLAEQ